MDDRGQLCGPAGRGRFRLSRLLAEGGRRELLLPVLLLALQLAGAAATATGQHGPAGQLGPAGWLLMAAGPVALVLRRRWPLAVLWVTLAATLTPWEAAWAGGQVR